MNILILCSSIRRETLRLFRSAAGVGGKVVAVGTDPFAADIYAADSWHLLPPEPEHGYAEAIRSICRTEHIDCAVVLQPQHPHVIHALHGEVSALCTTAEELLVCFPGRTELHDAYCAETEAKGMPPARKLYRAIVERLPQSFKTWVSLRPAYLTTYQENKRRIRSAGRQIVYLLDTPRHDNLGDHAIAWAQRKFIEKALPDAMILELPIELVDMHLKFIRRHIHPGDLFCFVGGGNFGDAYLMHEHSKRKVCQLFPDHRILIFPQTISYSDTPQGHRELELTQKALRPHRKLTITARDSVSHQRAKQWFPEAESILTPDIVLSLPGVGADVPRKGILCCLRRDAERNDSVWAGDVVTRLSAAGYSFTLSDTAGEGRVSPAERPGALEKKWREFCGAQLVVTDRLHGMIFACITSTPCIVLDNYNHKIRNFYRSWLSDIPYIRFAEQAEELLPLTRELLELGNASWDPGLLAEKYAPLWDALREDPAHE